MEKLKITYSRIKKPKKDELLIFRFPRSMGMQERFSIQKIINRAFKKDTKGLFIPNDIGIVFCKKSQIKKINKK